MRMMIVAVLLLSLGTPALGAKDEAARKIYDEALAAVEAGDAAAVQAALDKIDAELKTAPKLAMNHYVRGWILSRLARLDDSLASYDAAVKLDKKFADAHYNAGVVLTELKREAEAIGRFEKALKANPKHIDAAYNAGQYYYNKKDFKKSLARWSTARKLAPNDFDILKKVLQAQNALGKKEAKKTREQLIAMWKGSADPQVKGLKEFVFDQFDVGDKHIFAYETFEPTGDLYYLYTFRVTDPAGKTVGSVNLESSAVIREQGVPYIVGVNKGNAHSSPGPTYKTLPAYPKLRKVVEALVAKEFP